MPPSWHDTISVPAPFLPSATLAATGEQRYSITRRSRATNEMAFIKNSWRDSNQLISERLLLKQAHQDQSLSGIILPETSYRFFNETRAPIQTTCFNPESDRTGLKMRSVARETGSPLIGVHSLLKFLCTMYDACVVQRNLYRKYGILHRDISQGNIMFAPDTKKHRLRQHNQDCYGGVKFINQVLARDKIVNPEPACLVIDLGDSTDLKTERRDVLIERTGTPKFIARSISYGQLLNEDPSFSRGVDMPLLDESLAGYRQFMHTTEYQVAHSPGNPDPAKVEFAHRLFHDAESTLWVIAWTLITSVKTGSGPESGSRQDFSDFFYTMRNHFPQPGFPDSRVGLTYSSLDPSYWRTALHPDLAMLAPMLTNMFRYILPEWAHRPDLDDEHVHEALMRLLLAEIVKIKDGDTDIEIDIGGRQRPPPRLGL